MKESKQKNVIVITDCSDIAFAEMKCIIVEECKKLGVEAVSVDLVAVEEFSIVNAAFITRLLGECCPQDTIFSIVINPQRHRSARIYGKTKNGLTFFGANTGALTWLLRDLDVEKLYEINDPGFISFGGKYVHAPNIAKLVANVDFNDFGKPFPVEKLTEIDVRKGTIVHIDNFGLMKIMGDAPVYAEGQKFKIYVNGEYRLDAKFSNRMMDNEDREWILYRGSSLHGLPELGTVRYKYGFKDMNFKIGDVVTWEEV